MKFTQNLGIFNSFHTAMFWGVIIPLLQGGPPDKNAGILGDLKPGETLFAARKPWAAGAVEAAVLGYHLLGSMAKSTDPWIMPTVIFTRYIIVSVNKPPVTWILYMIQKNMQGPSILKSHTVDANHLTCIDIFFTNMVRKKTKFKKKHTQPWTGSTSCWFHPISKIISSRFRVNFIHVWVTLNIQINMQALIV